MFLLAQFWKVFCDVLLHHRFYEFVTPLRIRTQGEYNTNPDFVAFIHALLVLLCYKRT